MKKNIFIICSLTFIEIILILLTISHLKLLINNVNFYYEHGVYEYESLIEFYNDFIPHIIYVTLTIVAIILNIITIIIIVIKDFKIFKPLIDKFTTSRLAHKEKAITTKIIKNQNQITKLQQKLDHIKPN